MEEDKNAMTPEQLMLMHQLQDNCLPTSASISQARVEHQDWIPIARAFLDLCETESEAYWLFSKFVKTLDNIDRELLVSMGL